MTKPKLSDRRLQPGPRQLDGTAAGETPTDPTVIFQLVVLESQRDWLKAEAKRQDCTASELVRRWIEEKRQE